MGFIPKVRAFHEGYGMFEDLDYIHFDNDTVKFDSDIYKIGRDVELDWHYGEKDTEGTPVFENDIVEWDYLGKTKRQVVFRSDKTFSLTFKGHYEYGEVGLPFTEVKVIGNVRENPEYVSEQD